MKSLQRYYYTLIQWNKYIHWLAMIKLLKFDSLAVVQMVIEDKFTVF